MKMSDSMFWNSWNNILIFTSKVQSDPQLLKGESIAAMGDISFGDDVSIEQ